MRIFVVPGPRAAALARAAQAAGHDVVNDIRAHALAGVQKSERDAFLLAVDKMLEAELILADASIPDPAVGWCVAWFLAKGRLVVLACAKEQRVALSPMLAGNPSPWQKLVLYAGESELEAGVAAALRF